MTWTLRGMTRAIPDSKVHGANMGPTWVLSAPDGPHVGLMNLAIGCLWYLRIVMLLGKLEVDSLKREWKLIYSPKHGRRTRNTRQGRQRIRITATGPERYGGWNHRLLDFMVSRLFGRATKIKVHIFVAIVHCIWYMESLLMQASFVHKEKSSEGQYAEQLVQTNSTDNIIPALRSFCWTFSCHSRLMYENLRIIICCGIALSCWPCVAL